MSLFLPLKPSPVPAEKGRTGCGAPSQRASLASDQVYALGVPSCAFRGSGSHRPHHASPYLRALSCPMPRGPPPLGPVLNPS